MVGTAKDLKQSAKGPVFVGDYQLGARIGKGAYGVVYQAIHKVRGETVAIKQMNISDAPPEVKKTLQMEVELLKALKHKNIVRYIDHYEAADIGELYIVMEFVENGSLAQMVKQYGQFPEQLCKTYIRGALEGLVYLHDGGVIHRDIKGANILITTKGLVKLADFGVSQSKDALGEEANAPAGTPHYMAPEVIQFFGAQPASDIWSIGCTVIELITGDPPYGNLDPFAAMYKMVQEGVRIPEGLSRALTDFLGQCFTKDPNFRPTAQKLLKHPWLAVPKKEEGENVAEAARKIEAHKEKVGKAEKEVEEDLLRWTLSTVAQREKLRQALASGPGSSAAAASSSSNSSSKPNLASSAGARNSEDPGGFGPDDETSDPFADFSDEDPPFDAPVDDAPPPPIASNSLQNKNSITDNGGVIDLDADFGFDSDEDLFVDIQPIDSGDEFDEWGDDDGDLQLADRLERVKEIAATAEKEAEKEEEEDWIFDEGDEKEAEEQLEEARIRKKIEDAVKLQLDVFRRDNPSTSAVNTACKGLTAVFNDGAVSTRIVLSENAIVPLTRQLRSEDRDSCKATLRLILRLCEDKGEQSKDHEEILVAFCVMGVIPVIIELTRHRSTDIRRMAAQMVERIVATREALRMFAACGGLPVLVSLLSHPTQEEGKKQPRDLIAIAAATLVKFIAEVKGVLSHRKELMNHLVNSGLFDALANTLNDLREGGKRRRSAKRKRDEQILEGLLEICKEFASSEVAMKQKMAASPLLESLRKSLVSLEGDKKHQVQIVRVVKDVAVRANDILETLHEFIEPLVKFLREPALDNHERSVVVLALSNILQLSHQRGLKAVEAGYVPVLQQLISPQSSLRGNARDVAVQTLLELVGANGAHEKLEEAGVLNDYLRLCSNPAWAHEAFVAIMRWTQSGDAKHTSRFCNRLSRSEQFTNFDHLLDAIESVSRRKITNLSPLLDKLTQTLIREGAKRLRLAFCRSPRFLSLGEHILRKHLCSNLIEKSILSCLQALGEPFIERLSEPEHSPLLDAIALVQQHGSPLIAGLAKQILKKNQK